MNFRGIKETAKESVDNGYKAKYRTKIYRKPSSPGLLFVEFNVI